MATLLDIINDKEKYPDSTKMTLADGVESTVGDIRKGFMMEADYRKKTSDVSNQRKELDRKTTEFESARAQAENQLEELAKEVLGQATGANRSHQPPHEDELMKELKANPIANALLSRIESLTSRIDANEKTSSSLTETWKQRDQATLVNQHRRVLDYLKQNDPDLDTDALVRFARENYVPRLDIAYRVFTEEKRVKKAVDDAVGKAKKDTMEEAKRLAVQPTIPQRRPAVTLPKEAPATFDDAVEAALKDPDVIGPLLGSST